MSPSVHPRWEREQRAGAAIGWRLRSRLRWQTTRRPLSRTPSSGQRRAQATATAAAAQTLHCGMHSTARSSVLSPLTRLCCPPCAPLLLSAARSLSSVFLPCPLLPPAPPPPKWCARPTPTCCPSHDGRRSHSVRPSANGPTAPRRSGSIIAPRRHSLIALARCLLLMCGTAGVVYAGVHSGTLQKKVDAEKAGQSPALPRTLHTTLHTAQQANSKRATWTRVARTNNHRTTKPCVQTASDRSSASIASLLPLLASDPRVLSLLPVCV